MNWNSSEGAKVRVLVFPRDLELGGSSINAIDLAAAVRLYDHEPVIFSSPGPLEERLAELDLAFEPVQLPTSPRPSPRVIRSLAAAIRRHRIDLVHTYEYWPCVEALYGSALLSGRPVLSTIMSMDLPSYLPRSIPLTLGTRDLVRDAEQMRAAAAYLLEPPIDTKFDNSSIDSGALAAGELTVVIVSRIASLMKQEGIERAIDAVGSLGRSRQISLLVVGDGSAMDVIQERAARVNESLGRNVIVVTGAMNDPRPAYSAADIVVGMGSSVLRGMAFGKPAIVVGEQGFTLPVTPDTMATFDRTGFYGVGGGRPPAPEDPLVGHLTQLADDPDRRRELGEFGRKLVQERYSLDTLAAALDQIYRETTRSLPSLATRATDGLLTGVRVVRHKAAGRGLVRPARRGT